MKLEFLLAPTRDLQASLSLYRDGLGFVEKWREGDTTVTLALPDSDVGIMLDAADPDAPSGPVFAVDSVAAFHADRPRELGVVAEPSEIPDGSIAAYSDPGGFVFYVLDQAQTT